MIEINFLDYVISIDIGSYLAPGMFVGLIITLLSGYPVAFCLGGISIFFCLIGISIGEINPLFITALPQRILGIMSNFTLLAIPAFIFMGSMLESSGIAERLLESMSKLLGKLRGGLALAVVLVGSLLAATTGVVAATVTTMGLISLPSMLRSGYDKSLATGVIAASGTLGQIIPPSIVLVVLGDQLGVSVGDLFLGSLIPGVLMAGAFAIYVLVICAIKPELAPETIPVSFNSKLVKELVKTIIPPLGLILIVLGSIFLGIATPTEAGTLGAIGAIMLASIYGGFSRKTLSKVCDETIKTSSMVMAILIGSTAFSLVFRGVGGDEMIVNLISNVPGGKIGFISFSMILIFVLGFFIDFFEIAFIAIPLLLPSARAILGPESLLWLGVIIGANLQTSFLTPPFGFALFYLRGVAPSTIRTKDIYKGVLPFVVIQIAIVILIIINPDLVNWLPKLSWS